ncbi:MAG TPA: type II toxin-antitoxin system VapC family toxin [Anaerolineae bacterium]|nr:type II toxin-antitoxin system VapC family toxin [Anaerolineae bacterium]
MAGYLLDSGLVIRHLRGDPEAVQMLRELSRRARLGISVVTHLEVYAGMRPQQAYQTRKLLSRFVAHDVDREIAERAGEYVRRYRERGTSIPDAIVAATATRHSLTLVTLNSRHFPMPEIRLYVPAADT